MHLSRVRLALICLIIANLLWGASPPIGKWALMDLQPFTLTFLRFLIGTIVIFPFAIGHMQIKRNDIAKIFLLSFLGITLEIGFYIVALQYTSSINVPIIGSTGPIMLILGSIIFLHERLKKRVIIGTTISLIGILLIITRPLFEHGVQASIIGNLFLVISTLAQVVYTVLLKKYNLPYRSITILFWMFVIGLISFLPMFYLEIQSPYAFNTFTTRAWIGILYSGVFSSAVAYICYIFAVKYLVTSEVGIFVYIDPIVTALVAIPLLGETITFSYLLGSVLVFLGIFIAERRLHWHPLDKLKEKAE